MSLTIQFNTMLAMVVMGGWLGASLDTYGRFLKRPQRASWVKFSNDILFWIVQALLFFYVLLLVNEGEIRLYIVLAIICGFAAYQGLFKKTYLQLLEWFIRLCIWIYRVVYQLIVLIVIRPIRICVQLLLATLLVLVNSLVSLVKIIFLMIITPIKWISKLIWRILPQKVKKVFTNIAGIFMHKKNYLVSWVSWWKKDRK